MINIGDVDILKTIIDLELRIGTLEKAIETINNKNASSDNFKPLTQDEYDNFRIKSGEELIKKYPSLGLKFEKR